MTNIVSRLMPIAQPTFLAARPRDAAAIAHLHGASFGRGWEEDEVHRLLLDRDVITHRAMVRRTMAGFIMSRMAADEAEIYRSQLRRPGAAAGFHARCSTFTCEVWPASAPARSSLKSMSITPRPAGSTAAPLSTKWDADRATTKAAPQLWSSAATLADTRQGMN